MGLEVETVFVDHRPTPTLGTHASIWVLPPQEVRGSSFLSMGGLLAFQLLLRVQDLH